MLIEPETYDLPELSNRAGVSPRTVRYYIQQGLIPAPDARGPGSHYTAEHLDRLRLIKRLQREHLPLGEIRLRIEGLTAAEVRALLASQPEEPSDDARQYIRDALSGGRSRRGRPPDEPIALRSPVAPFRSFDMRSQPMHQSQWERLTLSPDVELHVRRPLSREANRLVERLIEAARHILKEEP